MRRGVGNVHLTKDYIESKVSQVSIMSRYLDIPVEVINECINTNKLIPSIFRDDGKKPSMGFAINKKGRLKVRDFGGVGTFFDVYDAVAYVLSFVYERKIEPNNKRDFYFILQHIAKTFSDIIDNKEVDENIDSEIQLALRKGKNTKSIIELVPRSWNKDDKTIWNKWGVSLKYLNTHFVIPVEQYYINRSIDSEPKYYYKASDPCYAYMLGQNRSGIYLIKLYFPLRNRAIDLKFITNCNILEGIYNLELDNYDYILITKSSKDRLSIGNHLYNHPLYREGRKLNIGIVNLPSENYRLKDNEYQWLNSKLTSDGMLLSLLDFDATGRAGAKYLEEVYNIPYLFITRGEFGLPNLKCKDFTDLHDKYSIKEIDNFIKDTQKYVEYRFESISDGSGGEQAFSGDNLPF